MGNVHIIIDEAALLAKLDAIDNAISVGRGYSLRVYLIYQSIAQLRKCFPDGQDVTLLSNVTQLFFAVNDNTTAEYISTRLGEKTIVLRSGGVSHGTSWQYSRGPQASHSSGGSSTYTSNWQLQARKLLKPEEVMALSQRLAITFTPGVRPIFTHLIRSYEEPQLGKEIEGEATIDFVLGLAAIARLAVTVCLAAWLTVVLIQSRAAGMQRPALPPTQEYREGVSYVTTR